jgi:hypothetical protein
LGGGHGHVLRGLALLTRLGEGTLLGPARLAPWAEAFGVAYASPPEPLERESLTAFLGSLGAPDLFLVDVFPRGLLGELEDLKGRAGASWLVTRRVRPAFYLHPPVRAALEAFERVIWTEDPPPGLEGLGVVSRPGESNADRRAVRLPPLLLAPPPLTRAAARARLGVGDHEPLVLALGAGARVTQARLHRLLVEQAARLRARLVFVSDELEAEPQDSARGTQGAPILTQAFPTAPLLPAADVVVSAGGYHAFHEVRAAAVPAVFLPQWRRYDDQWARVRDCLVADDPSSLERALRAVLHEGGAEPLTPPPLAQPEAGAEELARLVLERLGTTRRAR